MSGEVARTPVDLAVFDVDDVVIDTDHACDVAERSVEAPLSRHLPAATAEAVTRRFAHHYEILRVQLRHPTHAKTHEYAAYEARVRAWQAGVVADGHEVKIWSRDVMLAVALEDHGVPVTRALVDEVTAHYWRVMTAASVVQADARAVISRLLATGIPVHLATNSDGFLWLDEAAHTFRYDPPRARALKLQRLALVSELGLSIDDVTVGDPIGKPRPEFFDAVLSAAAARSGRTAELTRTWAIGDSLTNDVMPLVERGAHGAWLVRKNGPAALRPLEGHRRVVVVPDLFALDAVLG
ncbi:HAD family hydrolase [Myxococcota bacterium]|nr:HAD family hydrolase [Myxococcota bacterium]